jgi:hypothetical protein
MHGRASYLNSISLLILGEGWRKGPYYENQMPA